MPLPRASASTWFLFGLNYLVGGARDCARRSGARADRPGRSIATRRTRTPLPRLPVAATRGCAIRSRTRPMTQIEDCIIPEDTTPLFPELRTGDLSVRLAACTEEIDA